MINIRYPPWTICIIYIINFIFNFAWPLATKLQRKSWTCVVHNVFFSTVSKITLLSSLESSFRNTWKHLPLLVKIIHKSRLRYYGKFGLKIDFPFQVSLNFGRILRLSKNKMWRGSYLLDVLHIFNRFVVIECNIIGGFYLMFCFISGILWSCWPEWDNVACALERTLSRILPETECGHSVVHPKLHPEAELLKPVTPTNGPPQNEDL